LYDRLPAVCVSHFFFTPKQLHEQGIYKKEELLDVYKKMIKEKRHAENPIKITFKNVRCVKCGMETDVRLAERYPCHTEKVNHKHSSTKFVHTGYVKTLISEEKINSYYDYIPFMGNLIVKRE